ncbi:hypothetical protein [Candidatus Syntrophocurvum alkaliphilum]|uniref:hypothetical protein n=1 Tax=Candidatus Syntrophocurvum alkaliphilum TaxID=2293317 RepID=UPI0012E19C3F|nr:hypothetical protein [Candidatus Syntrophocurvum alkaliphilum]
MEIYAFFVLVMASAIFLSYLKLKKLNKELITKAESIPKDYKGSWEKDLEAKREILKEIKNIRSNLD